MPFRRVHQMVPEPGYFRIPCDADGDGDLDVLESRYLELFLLENTDHGRFERRLLLAFNTFPATPLVWVDLSDDGLPDLVTAQQGYQEFGKLGVWINSGAGFTFQQLLSATNSAFLMARVGDLDGDHDPDIYAIEGYAGPAPDTLFLNDGLGNFQMGPSLPVGTPPAFVELADMDRDDDLDVVRLVSPGAVFWINNGAGSFAPAATQPTFPPISGYPPIMAVADLTADTLPDIVLDNPPHLYVNQGEGRFTDRGEILPELKWPPKFADLDGDERLDAIGNVEGRDTVFINQGDAKLQSVSFLPKYGVAVNVVDVDDDEDEDLLGWSIAGTELWLNDGRAGFTAANRDAWESDVDVDSIAAGDLNGDGFPDALAYGTESVFSSVPELYLFLNRGDGTFGEQKLPYTSSRLPGSPMLADIDGDGDLDVLGNEFAREPVLLENQGHAEFVDASQRLPAPSLAVADAAFGDLDGDGDLDLLVLEYTPLVGYPPPPTKGLVWLNDGSGTFVDASAGLPDLPARAYSIVLGDVDGDLDLDAWMGSPTSLYFRGQDALWINDGTAAFTDATANLPSSAPSNSVGALADLDGDADLDLLAAFTPPPHSLQEDAHLFLNDGTGRFTDASYLWELTTRVKGELSTADFDEDGDADVIQASCGYWVNDGHGVLEDESDLLPYCPASAFFGVGEPAAVGIADFDLDGDLDVWYPSFPRPVMNTTRHVSWRSYPRAGKPLTMEVFGPANTPYRLFSSAGFTEPQATDYGYLRLATRGARLVASGTLDSLGRAAVTLGIPSDLAIPGNTVYWQALVGSPPRLTNLEFTTFRDL